MKATNFMFINKDAKSDSLSHSHKNERIQIHSHVQKGRRYKKSDGGLIHASQLPLLQPGPASSESKAPGKQSSDKAGSREKESTPKGSSFLQRRESPSIAIARQQNHERQDPNIDPLLWDYSQLPTNPSVSPPSVPTFPASAEENFDPFDVTCVKVDQAVYGLLQYFLRRFHPNIWHLERAIRPDHAYTFRYDAMTVVQGCLHDEYNMYALLAHMSSYMYGIERTTPGGDWELYMHKALKASQNYVKSGNPITGRMILNTFSLACAEWYRYNHDNAYVHFKAAKSMSDSIGGLRMLDAPLAELLLTGDAYVAGELKTKPLWSDSDFDNGDDHPMTAYALQELQNLLSGIVPTGSGLLTSSHQDIIPSGLRWVILDLAVVLSVLKSSLSTDPSVAQPSSAEGLHWTHIRSMAIRHRLLQMELEDARSDAIRTAIVLWMFICFTVSGRKRSAKVIAPFLRETLLEISDDEWQSHAEIHLWVLTVGSLCATVGSEEHSWFVAQMDSSLKESIRGSDQIFSTLVGLSNKFFYHEPAQKYNLRAVADDIQDMRRTRETSRSESKSRAKSPRA